VPRPQVHQRRAARAAVVIVAGAALAWAGYAARGAVESGRTPACSWPLLVHGTASPPQARLVRCYLRALAHRDTAGLLAVAVGIPPVRITSADITYSADARAGQARATFTPNPSDSTSCRVTITYANGATETTSMINMIAMGGSPGWRMNIGTDINPAPSGPPPAGPSPSS
jgi:hypothetical protein